MEALLQLLRVACSLAWEVSAAFAAAASGAFGGVGFASSTFFTSGGFAGSSFFAAGASAGFLASTGGGFGGSVFFSGSSFLAAGGGRSTTLYFCWLCLPSSPADPLAAGGGAGALCSSPRLLLALVDLPS